MLDPALTGSYLRDLSWSPDTPAANDRARDERFAAIRAASLCACSARGKHCALEVGLYPEGDHVLAWYQLTDLDGPWPGGDYLLHSLEFVFDPGTLGGRLDAEVLPGAEPRGLTAWKRRWGAGFWPGPLCRRFPLLAGDYAFSLRLRGSYAGGPPETEELPLGRLTVPAGLHSSGYGAANDLLVRYPDFDAYADLPPLVPPTGVTPPGWLEPFFAALDQAVEHVRQWHFCPATTENWYYRHTPAEGYMWNERYLGFYLNSFIPAYLLTGEPRYFQMIEYLYNTMLHNVVTSFWGGPIVSQSEGDIANHLLGHGILTRAVLRLARMLGNPALVRPLYEVYAAWPRDPQADGRLINVVYPDLTEQRKPLVYNQVMSSTAALWAVGHLFGDAELCALAERDWYDTMLPGFQPEGYWFYTQDAQVVTQHYDLVMKSDTSLWLEYDRWAQDEGFRQVMRKSLDFSLQVCATPLEDLLYWQPFYAGKYESSLALGKAGMGLEIMHRLAHLGHDQYREPIRQTARFIARAQETALDTRGLWHTSWFSCHVLAPLLECALAGLLDD